MVNTSKINTLKAKLISIFGKRERTKKLRQEAYSQNVSIAKRMVIDYTLEHRIESISDEHYDEIDALMTRLKISAVDIEHILGKLKPGISDVFEPVIAPEKKRKIYRYSFDVIEDYESFGGYRGLLEEYGSEIAKLMHGYINCFVRDKDSEHGRYWVKEYCELRDKIC